jgi:enoyl-CoA hydratase/carnithine racemase
MSATEAAELLSERRGAAEWITFNRPQARNAMTFAMYEGLFDRCEAVDADDDVRALVLRGAGGKAFVAGTDIAQFQAFKTPQDGLDYEARIDRVVGRLESVRKPTVALVDGYAVGGGLALAGACDLRICTPEAKFALPIARTLGNVLSMANYARLVALVGEGRVKDLVFNARTIDAEEAVAIGLATRIVPAETVEDEVAALCERLAGHSPITMRSTKEALRRLRAAGLPDGSDLVQEAYSSEDFKAAVDAFVERREAPGWRGR